MAKWKEITGYEGLYLVSDEGEVIALPKKVKVGNVIQNRRAKPLKKFLRGRKGLLYEAVALTKDGVLKRYSVHRLVAEAFIPNPDNLPEVNHIDRNTKNNDVNNLEWCSKACNVQYSKDMNVIKIDNGVVEKYKSITEASKITRISRTAINNTLKGWSKKAGGYEWRYCN